MRKKVTGHGVFGEPRMTEDELREARRTWRRLRVVCESIRTFAQRMVDAKTMAERVSLAKRLDNAVREAYEAPKG